MELAGNDLLWTEDIETSEKFLRKNLEESVAELSHEPIQGDFFIKTFIYITTGECDKIIFKRCKLTVEDLFYCKLIANHGNVMLFPQLLIEGYVEIDEDFITFTIPPDIRTSHIHKHIKFRDYIDYNDMVKFCQHEDYTYSKKALRYMQVCHRSVYCPCDGCIHVFSLNKHLDGFIDVLGNHMIHWNSISFSDVMWNEISDMGLELFESKPTIICYEIPIASIYPTPDESCLIVISTNDSYLMVREECHQNN